MRNFTQNAKAALMLAERFAKRMHQGYVGCEHILLGLVEEGSGTASVVLQENGVDAAKIREMIRDLIAFDSGILLDDKEKYSPRALAVLEDAHGLAGRFKSDETGTEHILLAMIKEGDNVAVRLINTIGVSAIEIHFACSGKSFFAIIAHAGQQEVAINGISSGTSFTKSSASCTVQRSAPIATSNTSAKPSCFIAARSLPGVTFGPNWPTKAGATAAYTRSPA